MDGASELGNGVSAESIKLSLIEQIQKMPNSEFMAKFSGKTPPPDHFSDRIGFFTTNEYDYPNSLENITVRGGIHLAVMGGVDPVLGQIAVVNPELTIMCDINTDSLITTTDGRIAPIVKSKDGIDYWNKVKDFFRDVVKKIDPKRQDFPSDSDVSNHGWSSPENFQKVKEAVINGKLKYIAGDITTDGIRVALDIARETKIPIRLIYVSNIFDYQENSRKEFVNRLNHGIQEGVVDPNVQIIDTSLGNGINTQILNIFSYAHVPKA